MKFATKFLIVAFVCFSSSLSTIWGKNQNVGNSFNIEDWSQADKRLATYLVEIYHKTTDAQRGFLLHFDNAQQMFNEIKKENTISSSPAQSQHKTDNVENVENVENVKTKKDNKGEEGREEPEEREEREEREGNEGKERKEKTNRQEEDMYKTNGAISLNSAIPISEEHMENSSSLSSPSPSPSPTSSPRFVQLKAKGPVETETIWRAIYATQLRRTPPTANVNVYSEENIEKEFNLAKMDAYASEIERMKIEFEKNLNYMSKELVRQRKIKETLKEVLLLEELIKNLEKKNNKIYKGGPLMRGSGATKTEC